MRVTPLNPREAREAKAGKPFVAKCGWFTRCTRPAVATIDHSVLGKVPVCAKCAAFAESK